MYYVVGGDDLGGRGRLLCVFRWMGLVAYV